MQRHDERDLQRGVEQVRRSDPPAGDIDNVDRGEGRGAACRERECLGGDAVMTDCACDRAADHEHDCTGLDEQQTPCSV